MRNPGCKTFSLIFNEGCNNNANMGEILELDIEACDLLPVIIDTSTWACNKYVCSTLFTSYIFQNNKIRISFHYWILWSYSTHNLLIF